MTPERWQQIKDICYAVLDRPPEARTALLHTLCGGDAGLRRDVEAMMADVGNSDPAMDRPAWELAGIPAATVPVPRRAGATPAWTPETIGTYRILRVIGEGGMGVVYEAQQDEPRRVVALKVIRPGFAGVDMLRRFRQESDALARLQHPGIAQVYAAGTADSPIGPQPYFAMELIRGEPVVAYADRQRLPVAQRLDLMARICDAVTHAHQRGLIHRDLKPANILVDETGQPKILDFGVARLTDSDVQRSQHTDVGQLIGTLAYMSPEQVLADPLELDTRSDVYALGVILYELLAGRLPYTLSSRLPEAIRTIQQEDPARLSSVSRVFRGDLETIAAKALEKDKTRRYGSASALAADIRRYLHNEPIAARPASAGYQLRKFARRHRALVSAVAAVFVVLVGGIVATTREAVRAREAEQAALAAEQAAQAVNDFLQNDLLAQASASAQAGPAAKPDPDLKVRTALDRAAARIESKFSGQPLVEASIRRTIGRTYMDLGVYKEAQRHVERAVELRRGALGETSPETVDAMYDLAELYVLDGKYELAEPLMGRVLELRRRSSGGDGAHTVDAINNLGTIHGVRGKLDLAEPLLRTALEIRTRISGEEHLETLSVIGNLAYVLDRRGKYAESESLFRKGVGIARRVLGTEHPDTLIHANNLAEVLRRQGRFLEAEPLMRETAAIRGRVLGGEHPHTQNSLNNLAIVLAELGQTDQAEELFRDVLERRQRVLGDNHPLTILSMNNLARVFRTRGNYAQAESMLTTALEREERVQGREHTDTRLVMSNLAFIYLVTGRSSQARALLEQTVEIDTRVSGPEHPDTLRDLERMALVLQAERQDARAHDMLAQVAASRRRVLGERHPDTMNSLTALGAMQLRQQRFPDAERTLRDALRLFEEAGLDLWQRYNCQRLLGATLAAQKMRDRAEPLLIAGYRGLLRLRAAIPAHEQHVLDDAHQAVEALKSAS